MENNTNNNLSDLNNQIVSLNEKYQINDFREQVKKLFQSINISEENIENIIRNPFIVGENVFSEVQNLDKKTFTNCLKEYLKLKKKFKYDAYLKEGNQLRKTFLMARKDYFFNSSKYIKFSTRGRVNNLERLNIDFAEQKFIGQWLDKLIKKISPNILTIQYEDLKTGENKTIKAQYKKMMFTKDYIEVPLIDRMIGNNMFDSFLMHSFYDTEQEKYVYVPLKFIININSDSEIDYDTI